MVLMILLVILGLLPQMGHLDNPWVIFKKKLQLLKSNLRIWNSSIRDRLLGKSRLLKEEIESIDAYLMLNDRTAELHQHRVSVIKELSDLDRILRVDLAQKAKVQWSVEG